MIATRQNPRTGRTEFRAYPQGRDHEDGGVGAWYAERAQAEGVQTAAIMAELITGVRQAVEAHQAAVRGPSDVRATLYGARARALDALYAELTTREGAPQLTALANDADLIDIAYGRQTIEYVNARRR